MPLTEKADCLCFLTKIFPQNDFEIFNSQVLYKPTEIYLKQRSVWSISIYQLPDQKIRYLFASITNLLDEYFMLYKDFIIIDYFNEQENNPPKESFENQQKCKKCHQAYISNSFKSVEESSIDVIITSRTSSFLFP